jgi:WD40 repeat protein
VAVERAVGELPGRSALVLGISGPDPELGEPELGAPAPLAEAPAQAAGLADSLAAYGYRDVLEALPRPDAGIVAAADVQGWIDAALAAPGPVVVHLLTHGDQGRGQTVLYVLGPDGARVQPSVGEWLNRAEERAGDFGPVLFVLDVCHAGAAVGFQLQQLVDARHQQAWVLAASSGEDPAYDGRLTRALTQVLEGFRSRTLQVDPSVRHIPLPRLFHEVDRLVREQSRGSYPQEIRSSYVPVHVNIDELEFFSNPGWDPALEGEMATLLDEAFDPRHFMRRAGAAEAVFGQVGRGFFHGRAEQLQQLRDWVLQVGPSLRVVTGKPGVGKSALLGVLVCAAHPALRERTRDLWDRLPHMPPLLPEGSLAVVHARRRTAPQIIASIARQWHLPAPGESDDGDSGAWTGPQLIAALRESLAGPGGAGVTRLLVVDAVDETDRPADLVAGVLSPLAAGRRDDGGPLCQILVAGRDEPHLQPLTGPAAAVGGVIDLGAIPRRQLRPALTAYVKDLLGYGTPYEMLPFAAAADVLAEAIAGTLTAGPGTDTDPAPQRWGEFLVAGLYVRHVLDLPPVQELTAARGLGEAVPRDLGAVLDLDLARPAPGLNVQVLRAVARALAFAEGSGMPEQIAQRAAAAFLPSPEHPAGLGSGETRKALDRLRFYLRRDVDVDGSTLYRLFHQGLADQLRTDASEDTTLTGPAPADRVWQHLNAMIPDGPHASRQWQHAEPYLLRHAAQHAAAAGRLDDLLQDASFLTHADPATLAPLLAALPAGAAGGAADTYRASYAAHFRQPPAGRAQILAVDAARYGNLGLAQRLSAAAIWQPVWATSQSRSAGLRLTMTGHTGAVAAVVVGRAGDRDIIVSGGEDGTVRVWDAVTGQPASLPLTGHTGEVHAVAVGRAGDRDVIVSDGSDRTVRVWDAVTGQPASPPRTRRTRGEFAMAVGRAGDREVIVSGGYDGTVRVWDAVTGQPASLPLTGHTGTVCAVAVGRAGDREVIVSGGYDGTVRVWDAVTGQPADPPLTGHTSTVHAVAVGRAGDREVIVSGGEDGTVRVWDAVTGQSASPPLAGHTGEVHAVAVGRAGDREIIVSGGEDGTVRVWDAATLQPAGPPLAGHTRMVYAVAVGRVGDREVVVSGSDDETVRVWDAVTGQPAGPPLTGHTTMVYAVAVGRAGDREIIVSGSYSGAARVWDAVTGQPTRPPPDQSGEATAVGRAGDREVIVIGDRYGSVGVWDAVTGQQLSHVNAGHTSAVKAVAVGRAGDRDIIVSGDANGTVRVWDALSGGPATLQPAGPPLTGHTSTVHAVAVGRAGDREIIVSGDANGTVRVWDAATLQPAGPPLTGHTRMVHAVAVGRAGDREIIVSGSWDGMVRVWDAATLQPVAQQQFPDAIPSLALADERLVAAQGNDVVVLQVNPAILPRMGLPSGQENVS